MPRFSKRKQVPETLQWESTLRLAATIALMLKMIMKIWLIRLAVLIINVKLGSCLYILARSCCIGRHQGEMSWWWVGDVLLIQIQQRNFRTNSRKLQILGPEKSPETILVNGLFLRFSLEFGGDWCSVERFGANQVLGFFPIASTKLQICGPDSNSRKLWSPLSWHPIEFRTLNMVSAQLKQSGIRTRDVVFTSQRH